MYGEPRVTVIAFPTRKSAEGAKWRLSKSKRFKKVLVFQVARDEFDVVLVPDDED